MVWTTSKYRSIEAFCAGALTCDRIFPIDDYYECLLRGRPKEARFMPNRKHMGEPESFVVIIKWFYELFGLEGNPIDQLKTLPFQPKY